MRRGDSASNYHVIASYYDHVDNWREAAAEVDELSAEALYVTSKIISESPSKTLSSSSGGHAEVYVLICKSRMP